MKKNCFSKKTVMIVGILWIASLMLSVGYGMGTIKKNVGMQVFDLMMTGYSYDYVLTFTKMLTPDVRAFYMYTQIPIDMSLAFLLGFFPVICFGFMREKTKICMMFTYFAVAIILLDITENILVFSILSGNVNVIMVTVSSFVTILKNIVMLCTYLPLIYFAMKYNFNILAEKSLASK